LFETELDSSSSSTPGSVSVATTTTAMHHQSSNLDSHSSHPAPSSVESFLRSATDHIAATCSLESFRQLPLPLQQSFPEITSRNSATNQSVVENRRGEKRMPPELCYNDDVVDDHSQSGPFKTMTSFEINNIGETTHDADDSHDDNSGNELGNKNIFLAVRTYFRKYKGCGHPGPEPLCWKQNLFSFVGSFVTIYLIYCFNLYISQDDYIQSMASQTTWTG